MLFLLFQIGSVRYALEASRVVEVIPLLDLKAIPQAPRGIAGMFNYRGQLVPALDVSEITTGARAAERLSTRILVVRIAVAGRGERLLGLIAERATTMLRKDPKEFVDPGLAPDSPANLGPVLLDEHGVIQWIQEQNLLPEQMRRLLFSPAALTANASH